MTTPIDRTIGKQKLAEAERNALAQQLNEMTARADILRKENAGLRAELAVTQRCLELLAPTAAAAKPSESQQIYDLMKPFDKGGENLSYSAAKSRISSEQLRLRNAPGGAVRMVTR